MAMVVLSASVKRFNVYCMRYFWNFFLFFTQFVPSPGFQTVRIRDFGSNDNDGADDDYFNNNGEDKPEKYIKQKIKPKLRQS